MYIFICTTNKLNNKRRRTYELVTRECGKKNSNEKWRKKKKKKKHEKKQHTAARIVYTANNLTFTMTRIGVFSSCLLFLFLFVSFQSFPVWFLSSYNILFSLLSWLYKVVVYFEYFAAITVRDCEFVHVFVHETCWVRFFFGFGLSTKLKRALSQTIHRLKFTNIHTQKTRRKMNEREGWQMEQMRKRAEKTIIRERKNLRTQLRPQ